VGGIKHLNAEIHAMLAFGYYVKATGEQYVRYKTSWGGSGNSTLSLWNSSDWQAALPVRGVVGYHPLPQVTKVAATNGSLTISWDGPASVLSNLATHESIPLHSYVVERAASLDGPFVAISEPTSEHTYTIPNCCGENAFFRVKLLPPPAIDQ
jgi:hypothetical protein